MVAILLPVLKSQVVDHLTIALLIGNPVCQMVMRVVQNCISSLLSRSQNTIRFVRESRRTYRNRWAENFQVVLKCFFADVRSSIVVKPFLSVSTVRRWHVSERSVQPWGVISVSRHVYRVDIGLFCPCNVFVRSVKRHSESQ